MFDSFKGLVDYLNRMAIILELEELKIKKEGICNESEIKMIERELDIEIPEEYKYFVSNYDPSGFEIKNIAFIPTVFGRNISKELLAFNKMDPYPDKVKDFYRENKLIEIARYGDNPVCLNVKGKVFTLDEYDVNIKQYLIADSLLEFLNLAVTIVQTEVDEGFSGRWLDAEDWEFEALETRTLERLSKIRRDIERLEGLFFWRRVITWT